MHQVILSSFVHYYTEMNNEMHKSITRELVKSNREDYGVQSNSLFEFVNNTYCCRGYVIIWCFFYIGARCIHHVHDNGHD